VLTVLVLGTAFLSGCAGMATSFDDEQTQR